MLQTAMSFWCCSISKLPGKDGLTLTREIRAESDIGVILVTSKQEQIDRILGLESGADDYVTKPFDPRELLSRARNLIRRVHIQQKQRKKEPHPYVRRLAPGSEQARADVSGR